MKNVFKILLSLLIFFNHATSFAIGKYYFSGNSDVDWVNDALPFIPEMYYIPTKQINNGDSTSFEFKQVQDLSDLAYVLTADNNLLLVEKYITVEGVPKYKIIRDRAVMDGEAGSKDVETPEYSSSLNIPAQPKPKTQQPSQAPSQEESNQPDANTPSEDKNNPPPLSGGDLSGLTSLKAAFLTAAEKYILGMMLAGETQQSINTLKNEVDALVAQHAEINQKNREIQEKIYKDFYNFHKNLTSTSFNPYEDSYKYKTQDERFSSRLKLNRQVLNSTFSFEEVKRYSKQQGLMLNQAADEAYSSGYHDEAEAYLSYARSFADIAVGLDPVTGTVRSVYEAFSGKNMITGDELSDIERTFAVVGIVSLGFGNKISKGLSVLSKTKAIGKLRAFTTKSVYQSQKILAKGRVLAQSSYREAYKKAPHVIKEVLETRPQDVSKFTELIHETHKIELSSHGGKIRQEFSVEALELYSKVKSGEVKVFRLGQEGKSKILEGSNIPEFWATQKELLLLSPRDYIDAVGGHTYPYDFIQVAKYTGKGDFIIRSAPAGRITVDGVITTTKGGALEAVFRPEGVPLENINRIEPEEIIHKLDTNRINDSIYRKYLIDKLF